MHQFGTIKSALMLLMHGANVKIENKPFIIINLSVIVIKLQIIRVHIWPFGTLRRHLYSFSVTDQGP